MSLLRLLSKPASATIVPTCRSSWLTKAKDTIGLGEYNRFALARTAVHHYEACTDKLPIANYFEAFKLPDTVFSFFLVTQLHVWMCQVRSMQEGPEGRRLRNSIMENLWQDLDTRLSRIDVVQRERKPLLTDLLFHFQSAMFAYDEGLLTDDKTLANAIWRTLYSKQPIDPMTLELVVRYIRAQIDHLRSIGRHEWCTSGKFNWAPFEPLAINKEKASTVQSR